MTYKDVNPNAPGTLEELIEQMQDSSDRNDFSEQYLADNGHILPRIGEFTYGTSYTPTYWVLPYLRELLALKAKS